MCTSEGSVRENKLRVFMSVCIYECDWVSVYVYVSKLLCVCECEYVSVIVCECVRVCS